MTQDMTSFVLRFIREITADQQTRWRGTINHVQSDTKLNFTQFAEAVRFMQAQMGQEVAQELFNPKLVAETTEAWGQVAFQYQEFMLQAWMEALTSPSRVPQVIAQSLGNWRLPERAQYESALQALEKLTGRVEELAHQVEQLEKQATVPAIETGQP